MDDHEELSQLSDISENNPDNNLIDDLYVLKSSLIVNGSIDKNALSYLSQISNLIEDNPDMAKFLYEWKFLEKEIILLMRSHYTEQAIQIASKIISITKKVPELYITKKFLFFISEKLYFALGGQITYKKSTFDTIEIARGLHDECINSSDSSKNDLLNLNEPEYVNIKAYENSRLEHISSKQEELELLKSTALFEMDSNQNCKSQMMPINMFASENFESGKINIDTSSEQIKLDETSSDELFLPSQNAKLKSSKSFVNYNFIKNIMLLVKEVIDITSIAVPILNDILFFELANACLCIETAQMFNSVFNGLTFSSEIESKKLDDAWTPDGIFEIRRPRFDPEVFFRQKNLFSSKKMIHSYKSGIYNAVYNQITNIRDFADIAAENFLNVLLYKRISYMNDALDDLIHKAEDLKILRFYRRSLENGNPPEKSYLNSFVKALDKDELSFELSVILFYYIEYIQDKGLFNESRIRSVIQSLEYSCEIECKNNSSDLSFSYNKNNKKEVSKEKIQESTSDEIAIEKSFNSQDGTWRIFGNSDDQNEYLEPSNLKTDNTRRNKSILEDFSEFENDFDADNDAPETSLKTQNRCERSRIILLIKHLYNTLDKNLFYKPSYLVLLRFSMTHVENEKRFFETFFTDFTNFIKADKKNLAKVFFTSMNKEKPVKLREILLEDIDFEPCAESQIIPNIGPLVVPDNKGEIRLNKNVIESEEVEMKTSLKDIEVENLSNIQVHSNSNFDTLKTSLMPSLHTEEKPKKKRLIFESSEDN